MEGRYFKSYLLCLFLTSLFSVSSFAEPVFLDTSKEITLDQGQLSVLRDASTNLTLLDVQAAWKKQEFIPLAANLSKGYVPDAFWLRFELDVSGDQPVSRWLEVMPPYLDNIQLYHINTFGKVDRRQGGDFIPQSQREESYRGTLFKLELLPGTHEFYIRLKTSSTMVSVVTLWQPEAFSDYERNSYFTFGIYFSLILTVLLFNFVNWVVSKRLIFIAYTCYLFLNILQWLGINGFVSEFIFPENPLYANLSLGMSLSLSTAMAFIFFSMLFELRRYHPLIFKLNVLGAGLGLVTAAATPFGYYQFFSPIMLLIALASLATCIWPLSRLWKTQLLWNRILVTAYASFVVLVSINILSSLALINHSNLTLYAGMASNVFHVLLLHFGLLLHYRAIESEHAEALERSHLAQQEVELEKKYNEEQAQLLAMLTHEIRTPIAVIDAATESLRMLDESGDDDSRVRRYARIRKAVMRMNAILEMGLAQMERERWPFDPKMTDIQALTFDVIDLTESDISRRIVLADMDEPLIAMVDTRLMNIAMLNLLDNAIKYSPSDSNIKITYYMAVEDNIEGVTWSVFDHGAGVETNDLDKIFQKGFRGHSTENVSGLGLGLYLVKRIAEQHQGHVNVLNRPEGGAAFSLWFPLKQS